MKSTTLCMALAGTLACFAALGCRGKASDAQPTTGQPAASGQGAAPSAQVGQQAPDFEIRDEAGNLVRLADHRGQQPVLLAFYPKDFTSG